jgi:predicted nuclease of restriction endonuclease-like (RecB) superfamily
MQIDHLRPNTYRENKQGEMVMKKNRKTAKTAGKIFKPVKTGLYVKNETDFFQSIAKLIQYAKRNLEKQVNMTIVITYFEIGRRIIEREQQGAKRAQYGKKVLQGLSDYLTAKLGKGWSIQNLRLMRQFYIVYSKPKIRQPVVSESGYLTRVSRIGERAVPQLPKFNPQISWKQYLLLMRITNPKERSFYEIEIANNGWSFSELQRQYDSSLYERLALSGNKKKLRQLAAKGQVINTPQDLFKEPYVLEFTGLPEKAEYTENDLEQKLIDHLQQFLLELGNGFAFMGRQVRFTFEDESFFVDLVFYNRLLKCFVLIDLKIGRLKHQDIGQMQMYVNYYDRKIKLPEENSTIGIVLCRDKKDAMVEMMLPEKNKHIFAGKFKTVLPGKDELKRLLKEQ